jgi:outer membrane lipoprotein-sorting protein
MNHSKLFFATLLLIGATLSSCSSRLVGSWAIQKYETTSSDQQGASLNDIGFMVFNSDGTGEKNISYTLFGVQTNDALPFRWTATDKYVTIESEGSSFSKTWILIENRWKFQKWESTDGSNQVQTLELKRTESSEIPKGSERSVE